ncbi:hypothetical protein HPB47_016982 [Ixodes persulcatus]|uniref:Uncharacterized protein n=1 Tax=Ixodes persulcatus TaxID=34615 RepID=A0AC60QPK7_IXOPE|nr:hypothetical protein HPB47_016982 [Ixodes persulcatus]
MNEADLQKLTPELLGAKPNTYVFTKSLAESIVAEHGRGLPSVIVRPSIVSASWREPFPGWVEGLHGGNFLVASSMMTPPCLRTSQSVKLPLRRLSCLFKAAQYNEGPFNADSSASSGCVFSADSNAWNLL